MLNEHLGYGRKHGGITGHSLTFPIGPVISEPDRLDAHARTQHFERPVRDQPDTQATLHHPTDGIKAWYVDPQIDRLSSLGGCRARTGVDRAVGVEADMII